MELQPIIISAGLVIGVLIGLTGMGGGALMTPFLIIMGVRPSVAVGTDLFQMMFTKSFGAWQHHRQGAVSYRVVLPLIMGSLPGALLGVVALKFLGDHSGVEIDVFLTRLLGGVLTLAGVFLTLRLLFRGWISHKMDSWGGLTPSGRGLFVLVGLGAVIGLLVGLTSVGSGTLFIVMLTTLMRMTMRNIVGTDVAHSALLTAGAGLLHLGFGNVDLALAANILIGSIPGVIIGSRLTVRIPERGLRMAVALALTGVGLKLL